MLYEIELPYHMTFSQHIYFVILRFTYFATLKFRDFVNILYFESLQYRIYVIGLNSFLSSQKTLKIDHICSLFISQQAFTIKWKAIALLKGYEIGFQKNIFLSKTICKANMFLVSWQYFLQFWLKKNEYRIYYNILQIRRGVSL